MTSEGLGEMFEGDSADTCTGKFLLVSMGPEHWVLGAQTRERGPTSALAEIVLILAASKLCKICFNWAIAPSPPRPPLQLLFIEKHD